MALAGDTTITGILSSLWQNNLSIPRSCASSGCCAHLSGRLVDIRVPQVAVSSSSTLLISQSLRNLSFMHVTTGHDGNDNRRSGIQIEMSTSHTGTAACLLHIKILQAKYDIQRWQTHLLLVICRLNCCAEGR